MRKSTVIQIAGLALFGLYSEARSQDIPTAISVEDGRDSLNLGISLLKAGHLVLAETQLNKVLTEKPQSPQVYYLLGMIAPSLCRCYNALGVLYDRQEKFTQEVHWPNRCVDRVRDVNSNQIITIRESQGLVKSPRGKR